MHITFAPCPDLPDGVLVSIVEGPTECVIQLNPRVRLPDLCEALSETIEDWACDAWVYVGAVERDHRQAG